jgi:hypothetical protein
LEAVHELGTGQEAFVKDEGERLRHEAKVSGRGGVCQRILAAEFWREFFFSRWRFSVWLRGNKGFRNAVYKRFT